MLETFKGTRQEILSRILEIPDLVRAINTPYQTDIATLSFSSVSFLCPLHSYIAGNTMLDPTVVKIMLDLGADIDITDSNGSSPLALLLKEPRLFCSEEIRKTLELLIYENPCPYLNGAATLHGLQQDVFTRKHWKLDSAPMPKHLQIDGQMHSIFGHNHKESFALNFVGPLLIECGFSKPTASSLLKIDIEALDPTEKAYLQKIQNEPRSLKLYCRNSLRRYFRGRSLHKFVSDAGIPNSVENYILLKDVLLCIN